MAKTAGKYITEFKIEKSFKLRHPKPALLAAIVKKVQDADSWFSRASVRYNPRTEMATCWVGVYSDHAARLTDAEVTSVSEDLAGAGWVVADAKDTIRKPSHNVKTPKLLLVP